MGEVGKKINLLGYIAAALGAAACGFAALMIFFEDDFFYGINNLGNLIIVGAMFVVAIGAALRFFGDRDFTDLIVTGTAVVTLIINIFALSNEEGYLWYRDFFTMVIMNGLSVCVMLGVAVKAFKSGNQLFAIAAVLVFLYFAIIAPVLFYVDLSDELWAVLLIFNAGVKFAAYGLSVISINQENN